MPVERLSARADLLEVLDRVLDKGVVIDAWLRVSLMGLDLLAVEARVIVASIETYAAQSDLLGEIPPIAAPVGRAALVPAWRPVARASRRRSERPARGRPAREPRAPFGPPRRVTPDPLRESAWPRPRLV